MTHNPPFFGEPGLLDNVQKDTTLFLSIRVAHSTVRDRSKPLRLASGVQANGAQLLSTSRGTLGISTSLETARFGDGKLRISIDIDVADPYLLAILQSRGDGATGLEAHLRDDQNVEDDQDEENLELESKSARYATLKLSGCILQCTFADVEPDTKYFLATSGVPDRDAANGSGHKAPTITLNHECWRVRTGPMTAFRQITLNMQDTLRVQRQTKTNMAAKYSPGVDAAKASVAKYKALHAEAKAQLAAKEFQASTMTTKAELDIAATEKKLRWIKNNSKKFRDEVRCPPTTSSSLAHAHTSATMARRRPLVQCRADRGSPDLLKSH